MATSLEILEESLDRIYACRKRLLQAKISHKSRHTNNKPIRKLPDIETEYFSTTYRASTSVDEADDDGDDSVPTDIEKDDIPKLSMREADDMAKAVFKEFQSEVSAWIEEDVVGMKRNDSEYREDYADYLTEKFMCNRLDPLPSSEIVSCVRKNLSGIIENFASDGGLPKNFKDSSYLTEVLATAKLKNRGGHDRHVPKSDHAGGGSPTGKATLSTSSAKTASFRSDSARDLRGNEVNGSMDNGDDGGEGGLSASEKKKLRDAERLAQEKQRMKDQYEAYMKKNKQPSGLSAATAAASILGPLIKTKSMMSAGNLDTTATSQTSPAASTAAAAAAAGGGGTSTGGSTQNISTKPLNSTGPGPVKKGAAAVKLQTPAPLSVAPGGGNSNLEEAQQLSDDIRSLLSSIQSKPTGIPPKK